MTFWDGLKGLTLTDIFMNASPIPKMIMIFVMFNACVALILAILRHATKGPRSSLLIGIGAGAVFLCSFGALYDGFISYTVAKQMNITNLAIVAPSIAEAALCFSMGIIVMLIAVIGNWGALKTKG